MPSFYDVCCWCVHIRVHHSTAAGCLTGYFPVHCHLFCQLVVPGRCPDNYDCVCVESSQPVCSLHVLWALYLPSSVPALDPSAAGNPLQWLHHRGLSWWETHFLSAFVLQLVLVNPDLHWFLPTHGGCLFSQHICSEHSLLLYRYCCWTRLLLPSGCVPSESGGISYHSNTTIHVRVICVNVCLFFCVCFYMKGIERLLVVSGMVSVSSVYHPYWLLV